jgi:ankyrin repeat protein
VNVNARDEIGKTPLHVAAAVGNKGAVELLLAKGADANAKDQLGKTPLHWAAAGGQKEVAELLIAKGADILFEYNHYPNKNFYLKGYNMIPERVYDAGLCRGRFDGGATTARFGSLFAAAYTPR